jgi:hypothetical protein
MQHVLSIYIGILLTPQLQVAKELAFIIREVIKINDKILLYDSVCWYVETALYETEILSETFYFKSNCLIEYE